jgi:hypothetical protein
MDGARGALEVRQHFDEHGVPVGLTDEEFRDTGGGLRHDEIGLAPNIQGNGIGLQIKWALSLPCSVAMLTPFYEIFGMFCA